MSLLEGLYGQLLDFMEVMTDWVRDKVGRLKPFYSEPEVSTVTVQPDTELSLSQAWVDFVEWKGWTEKYRKDNQRLFDNLVHFVGDVGVSSVTKTDLKTALTGVALLPQRNKKQYAKRPLHDLTKMTIPEEDRVSSKYVKEHLKLAQSLFSTYLLRELDVIEKSPTEGLRYEHEDKRFASLGDTEVRQIITRSKTKPKWFQWYLLLAFYSGGRRKELASLRSSDFKFDESCGRYYFSWTYLLTIAHVLLFKNDTNIEDEDQVEIMREVVNYFEHDKSGIVGVNQMSPSWTNVVEKINAGASLSASNENVYETVRSWHQEERDIALMLSRELGVLVSSGESKFKEKLEERLKDNSKDLVKTKQLSSVLKVKGAASDIKISAMFEKRTVEMVVSLKPPTNMTYKGQLGWIKRQFDSCGKKDEAIFESLSKSIYLEVLIKSSSKSERFSLFQFDTAVEHLKNKEIREFRIVYLKDFGKGFASPKKFVVMIDSMLKNYYKGIVQHLVRWGPTAPKMTKETVAIDDESFIGNPDSEEWTDSIEPTESLLTTAVKENIVEPAT